MFKRADYTLKNGKLKTHAFPGGYPLYYLCADGGVLCPDCANSPESKQATEDCPDDRQWLIISAEIILEDEEPWWDCDHCGKRIISA